jgi:hypothetical protein
VRISCVCVCVRERRELHAIQACTCVIQKNNLEQANIPNEYRSPFLRLIRCRFAGKSCSADDWFRWRGLSARSSASGLSRRAGRHDESCHIGNHELGLPCDPLLQYPFPPWPASSGYLLSPIILACSPLKSRCRLPKKKKKNLTI